jgi:hypothetical protein
MADLKLKEWFEMLHPFALMSISSGDLVRAKSPELSKVTQAYSANCSRVFFMQRLPSMLFNAGRLFQVAESLAASKLEGDPFKYAWENNTLASKQVVEFRDDFIAKRSKLSHAIAALTQHEDLLAAADRHAIGQDVELMMSMQLMSAWTVFETLLGDMLKIVLGKIRLDSNGKPIRPERFYPARFVQEQGVLWTYSLTFHIDGAEINRIVNDDSFLSLFAVRNLIAHKAGKCDDKYLEYVRRLKTVPQLKFDEQLILDGEWMRSLIVPVLDNCIQLIHHVDHWLIDHP